MVGDSINGHSGVKEFFMSLQFLVSLFIAEFNKIKSRVYQDSGLQESLTISGSADPGVVKIKKMRFLIRCLRQFDAFLCNFDTGWIGLLYEVNKNMTNLFV